MEADQMMSTGAEADKDSSQSCWGVEETQPDSLALLNKSGKKDLKMFTEKHLQLIIKRERCELRLLQQIDKMKKTELKSSRKPVVIKR